MACNHKCDQCIHEEIKELERKIADLKKDLREKDEITLDDIKELIEKQNKTIIFWKYYTPYIYTS